MNEPSSFVDGSADSCPDSDLEMPPYTPSKCTVASIAVPISPLWGGGHIFCYSVYALSNGAAGLVKTLKKKHWCCCGKADCLMGWITLSRIGRDDGNLQLWVSATEVNSSMLMRERTSLTSSSFDLIWRWPHFNRSCRRPAELQDSVHVSTAEGVHTLQLAQHVWTDRGLRHLQVRFLQTPNCRTVSWLY